METKRITTQKEVDGPLAAKLHGLGKNLYLDVQSATSRQWLFIYKQNGRQRSKGLGSASGSGGPKIALGEARKRADGYRADLGAGLDPIAEERRETTTFADYCETVIGRLKPSWRHPKTEAGWRSCLLDHAAPLAHEPVATIDPAMLKAILDPLRHTKRELARHLRQRLEHVMREAKADGLRTGDNPASRENLGWGRERGKRKVRHHPAMPYEMLPKVFAVLDNSIEGHAGLKLLILTVTRTNEVVGACWNEFKLDGDPSTVRQAHGSGPVWTIPAARVKNGADHHVPLTKQMLALLASLPRREGSDRLFPDYGGNTMLPALKRIEGCDGFTAHGFRSTFKDWCGNETPFARDIVEETYGHDASENSAERAYRRRKAMKKRRMVLEAWNAYSTMVLNLSKEPLAKAA